MKNLSQAAWDFFARSHAALAGTRLQASSQLRLVAPPRLAADTPVQRWMGLGTF